MAVNDSDIGVQLDNGETITRDGKAYKCYKLRANKNASNATIKELANKDLIWFMLKQTFPGTSHSSQKSKL